MTPHEQSSSTTPTKRDHRQEVTDSIVKMLEEGVAPWQKPWESAGMPFNPTTDKAYRGGNAVHLMATGLSRGYDQTLIGWPSSFIDGHRTVRKTVSFSAVDWRCMPGPKIT